MFIQHQFKTIRLAVLFLWVVFLASGCTYQRGPMLLATVKPTAFSITPTAGQPQSASSATNSLAGRVSATQQPQTVFPITPEALVQAFILAQQDQSKTNEDYLSSALRSKWGSKKLADLIAISGTIQGSAIQSGAVSNQPPAAKVVVGLLVNGKMILRRFSLVKENDHWVIDEINSVQ